MLRIDPPNYDKLPENFREAVRCYVAYGVTPGNTLYAILTNNLLDTVCRLQPDLLAQIEEITLWFHWEVPSRCWGSPDKVKAWIGHQGCWGLDKKGSPISNGDTTYEKSKNSSGLAGEPLFAPSRHGRGRFQSLYHQKRRPRNYGDARTGPQNGLGPGRSLHFSHA